MRRFWLICASAWLAGASAAAAAPRESLVVEFRLNDRAAQSFASRDEEGAFHVDAQTLRALGIVAPDGEIALRDFPGLTYRYEEAEGAVLIQCSAACFSVRTIDLGGQPRVAVQPASPGAYLNMDLAASAVERERRLAGAFELVGFGPFGSLASNFVVGGEYESLLRLDTNWTLDFHERRTSLRLGDSITRGGATGAPFRFGGVQLATDFSLDPAFVSFPTPTLRGEAATPSTVDLYVDGALRMSTQVDAGAFSIVDAPVLVGAGVAQLVVTDPLGREQVLAQPFYASPALLRRGLSDYSLSLGLARRDFARASADYADPFVSGVYRRGLTAALTGEARLEADKDLAGLGLGGSFVDPVFGQFDLAIAASEGESDGSALSAGWTRTSLGVTFGLHTEGASPGFRRLGEDAPPDRRQTSGVVSVDLDAYGAAALSYAARDARAGPDVRTLAFTYAPLQSGYGQWSLDALWVEEARSVLSLGVRFAAPLWGDASGAGRVRVERGDVSAALSLHDMTGAGLDWRANGSVGEIDRFDAAVRHTGRAHEAALEASRVGGHDGLRLQFAAGLVFIDGDAYVSRPIRGSFAVVDVGRPDVPILRDRRRVGVTGIRGRFLMTDLRANEANAIAVALDDLPFGVLPVRETIEAAPPARSGIVVRFELGEGVSGETHVVDETGAALPAGVLLQRRRDGARFPVGEAGRTYLTDVVEGDRLASETGCMIAVSPQALAGGAPLSCRRA
ncbi:MAG: fimbrial biogenesis outer membrane usher protein [Hyphomonadaceae bacterium]|nr:fimbrial biogenesis outer membrane usher protein [Hyphomonadaceae bacterium]